MRNIQSLGVSTRLGERVLLSLSRDPVAADYSAGDASDGEASGSLRLLNRVFPNFAELVAAKRVADFGCGVGRQCISLVQQHGCLVVGIESNKETLQRAQDSGQAAGLVEPQLIFADRISVELRGGFDIVISQNSFEHFPDPKSVLDDMASLLKPDGKILITFGPPWYSPYGSHMHFFCKVPWINLLFSEATVMKARSHFRSDGALKYEDVTSGLNKMSIRKFEQIVNSSGLEIQYRKYRCVKGVNILGTIPIVRELFINSVTVILKKA